MGGGVGMGQGPLVGAGQSPTRGFLGGEVPWTLHDFSDFECFDNHFSSMSRDVLTSK
ncbi:hypothetical protein DPMN_129509 [Dreissena polymorpha]|uniref:Uncharacterized protein n=1 Tax=Dreissena polymorpha TaxID=45954 RepID=A0A9D4K0L5_DREPO|nr:hypothetical protein DPMN_129509 [Dreissena polymorpha]